MHDTILREPDILAITRLPKSTRHDLIRKGLFPRPLKLGARAVGWRESTIREWMAGLSVSTGALV